MAEPTIDPELLKKLVEGNLPSLDPTLLAAGKIVMGQPNAAPPSLGNIGEQKELPMLSHKDQMRLPMLSPGVQAGTAADYENRLERLRAPADQPTTTLGKIGHGLAKIGNIAGDIVAPGVMMNIPGTELHKQAEISAIEPKLERARETEEATAERQASGERAERKESSEEEERAARATNLKQKDSETLAAHGLMRDEEGNVKPDPTSPVYQKNQLAMDTVRNVQRLRDAQKELIEAKTEVERAKNDPNSPAFKAAQQRLAMAAEAHRVAAQNLALHQEQFENKLKEQELVKPSGQAQSRGSAAQAVLDVMPEIRDLVHQNAKSMGPIMGRLEKGEILLGDVDPKIAKLYSAMKSFYALQPAVHGFRNAEFVKDFETALGTLERDPEAFIAGMEGLAGTLKSVAKEGKTFHKRIVEGREETPAPAAGNEGEGSPFDKWKNAQKKP